MITKYFASPAAAIDVANFWRRKRSMIASAVIAVEDCQGLLEVVKLDVLNLDKFIKYTDGMECIITDTPAEMIEIANKCQ